MMSDEELMVTKNAKPYRLNGIKEIINLFSNPIQKDYISKYTPYLKLYSTNDITNINNDISLPQTESYLKIKNYFKPISSIKTKEDFNDFIEDRLNNDSMNINDDETQHLNRNKYSINSLLDFYNVNDPNFNTDGMCNVNRENINCHIGNVNVDQLANGFMNGYDNIIDSLKNDKTINEPFATGKIDLLKYISIIASRDISQMSRYDSYLKNQVGKDILERDLLIVNDEVIMDIIEDNDVFKNSLPNFNNQDRTNMVALFILGALDKNFKTSLSIIQMYDILMKILLLLHQGIPGEIQILFTNYTSKIASEINNINGNIGKIDILTPRPVNTDDSVNYKSLRSIRNKYTKIIINENDISIYVVFYSKFLYVGGDFDPFDDGHFFFVLHFDVLNNFYELNYLTCDINYKNFNYDPTKLDKIKENMSDNKTAATTGTLLALGALSAIPLALLLGGKYTKRMRGGVRCKCSRKRKIFKRKISKRKTSKRKISKRNTSKRKRY
jgi:hypothetical protein